MGAQCLQVKNLMSDVGAILTVLLAGLGLAIFAICRFALARPEDLYDPRWLEELCTNRYRPMMRLLDGRDLEFLRSQPAVTPQIVARLRQQRCRIFRGYLKCLTRDFQRVCWAIRILMMQANQDRPDLARLLLRSQLSFALGVCNMHVRVTLFAWGVGTVDMSGLLKRFDLVRRELCSMRPAAAASIA